MGDRRALDLSLVEVLNRLNEMEREIHELKLRVGAALSVDRGDVEAAVGDYLALRGEVSRRWVGEPSVLEELGKSRGHER